METEASRKLVLDYYAAQAAGDSEAIARILDDDVEWVPPSSAPIGPGPFRGREFVLSEMMSAGKRFFDMSTMRSEIRRIVADGDTVMVRTSASCKAANGRDYSNEYVWVFVCADGKIVRMEEHTDSLRFQQIVLAD